MELRISKVILQGQETDTKICGLSWAPNNRKLAVATADRQILLFDEHGEQRDKFSTKPLDPSEGKESYIIKGIAFGSDSVKLAVAQTDNVVYVYRIGENWGDKKSICAKFPQSSPVTCLTWLLNGSSIICGLEDGRVRNLMLKLNKSQSIYTSESLVVSITSNIRGTGFICGHADGNIIRYYLADDQNSDEAQGRIILYPEAPTALAWTQGYIFVAGCDMRVSVYNNHGKLVKTFNYIKDREKEFTQAVCSPSGQAVIVGSYNILHLYLWNNRKSLWEEAPQKYVENLYTITSLAWKKDGSRVVCGGLFGAVIMFESVMRKSVWNNKFEITYVASNQVLVKPLNSDESGVILKSQHGAEIDDIKIMGDDTYLVARTRDTLLLAAIEKSLLSEIFWDNHTYDEKFYFDNPSVCVIFNAGELSLIEYGKNGVLCSVRTEFANPHLMSVRLNERNQTVDNKKLAYLLDLKTICVVDLVSGITISQITNDSKIDWLELNEMGQKLLFRDKKQRLILADVLTQSKQTMFTEVSFAQWVEGSDVAVAQAGNNLAIWYNIDMPENSTVIAVKGDVTDVVRSDGKTEAVCVDGDNTFTIELDEGLVEFGTALHDNDYSRAVLFLETIGATPEAQAMWHNLLQVALERQNLQLAERCQAALGNVAAAHFLKETADLGEKYAEKFNDYPSNSPEVHARLSIFEGDLNAAENIFLEQDNIEGALEMYKKLYKWDQALRLAKQRDYGKFTELQESYMSLLMETNQFEKIGELLENDGKYEQALNMYMKSNKFIRIPTLLIQHPELMRDMSLVANVLKNLLREELYEAAAEIYEKLDKPDLALECFKKGKAWSKALDLARVHSPDQVVDLEEQWGDSLVESKQLDAAISHYIEAGATLKALDAAVGAKQWKKAIHIIKVVEMSDTVKTYYETLGNHFASVKDYKLAEKLYVSCKMYREAVLMYNQAGLWEKAHKLASVHLERKEVTEMYLKQAEKLEDEKKYRDAEKLYLSVDSPDLAIAMYKRVENYDNMIRLVERYHPDLLQTTHMHLAQQLESQSKYRASEVHYLAAGEWKAAINMYRGLSMWEEAYRVAKQNGGASAANQVAYHWAHTLPVDSAIKLLNKYGVLDSCINIACESYEFDFAFQLCKNLPSKINEVHYKYAMALEDEGKLAEAEEEFIKADKAKEAILMYVHAKNWLNALRVAESHDPSAVPEVLQAQAAQSFSDKQYQDFESLLLRAQAPELIVEKYKSEGMWIDALRVSKDYLPQLYSSLQAEYSRSHQNKLGDMNIEILLGQANEWALAGQHKQAVDCLLQVNTNITEPKIVRRALVRAADMVNKFLFGQDVIDVIKILSQRLVEIGETDQAAKLYLNADMMKEAIDIFMVAEEWNKARKLAKELDPAYENYVESKYKDRLLKKGDVEQLADVDLIGALDLLAEQGQWNRCIEKAKTHNPPVLHKYVALYASELLKDGFVKEALNLYSSYGAPAVTQNFSIYNQIATEMFAQTDLSGPESYSEWEKLRQMLFEINESVEKMDNVNQEIKIHFKNLLMIAHFYALRATCREVPSLKAIGVKISTALLRYTDIIAPDKAFYEAGMDMKNEGRKSEGFIFWNHYLDLCEAIEDGEGQLVDHTDLIETDFPSNVPLPEHIYLKDDIPEHDSVRDWVLTISMDQRVEQALPLDDRQLYPSSLQNGEPPCIITGYPVRKQAVIFEKNGFRANKDAWSKLNMSAKMSPDSNVSNVLSFIQKWCGNPTN